MCWLDTGPAQNHESNFFSNPTYDWLQTRFSMEVGGGTFRYFCNVFFANVSKACKTTIIIPDQKIMWRGHFFCQYHNICWWYITNWSISTTLLCSTFESVIQKKIILYTGANLQSKIVLIYYYMLIWHFKISYLSGTKFYRKYKSFAKLS